MSFVYLFAGAGGHGIAWSNKLACDLAAAVLEQHRKQGTDLPVVFCTYTTQPLAIVTFSALDNISNRCPICIKPAAHRLILSEQEHQALMALKDQRWCG